MLLLLLLLPSSRIGGMRSTMLWREARRLCIEVEVVEVEEAEGEVGPLAMSAAGGGVMGDGERARFIGVVGEGVDDLADIVVGMVTTVLVIFVDVVGDSGASAIVIASAVAFVVVSVVVVVPSASPLSSPLDETGLVGDADLDDDESGGVGGEGEGEATASMPMAASPMEELPPFASCMVFVTLVLLV